MRLLVVALILLVAGIVVVGLVLSWWQTRGTAPLLERAAQLPDPEKSITTLKDLAQYQTDYQIKLWTSIVQAIGVVVLGAGGYFTWRNLRATQAKLDIDREGQITNRFTQAVAQLGAELKDGQPNLEVRLGGIYALERIARDSPRDHWTIMEVLTAYVRQNAQWSPPPATEQDVTEDAWSLDVPRDIHRGTKPVSPKRPRTDIQAILTVLGRRVVPEEWPEPANLDLVFTDLRWADLGEACLERVDLGGAHLEGAGLRGAHLEEATLFRAHLEGAGLRGAHLERANLLETHLERADLSGVHLEGANLLMAHLEGADLREAHLEGADLRGAHLEEADLGGADLEGADLHLTHLGGVDLSKTQGLPPDSWLLAVHDREAWARFSKSLKDSGLFPEPVPEREAPPPTPEPP